MGKIYIENPFALLDFFFTLVLLSQKSLKVKKMNFKSKTPSKVCCWKGEQIVV